MAQSYKAMKEGFVSGLNGGSVGEVVVVTTIAPIGYLLWAVLQSRHNYFSTSKVPQTIVDYLLNVGALLLVMTVYSRVPIPFALSLLVTSLVFYLRGRLPRKTDYSAKSTLGDEVMDTVPIRPFVTAYRGTMMVVTCLAILAVDFKIFPRRFAKVETWGTSLMDMGVGSFVFAAGFISARPIIKARIEAKATVFRSQMLRAIKSSIPLIVLGFIRLYSVKKSNYAEHVTEYGVHWNFFFTLGLLPPLVALCAPLGDAIRCFALPLLLMTFYQVVLDQTRLKAFILIGPRTSLLSQNREGIFSMCGYLAIFLASQGIGLDILHRQYNRYGNPTTGQSVRKSLGRKLFGYTAAWFLLYALSTSFKYGLRIQTSRRLANGPYVEWVMWFNCGQLFCFFLIEATFFPEVHESCTKSRERSSANRATSNVLHSFNRNGLLVFLVANLLTGLVNLTFDTLSMVDIQSLAVLAVYSILLTWFAVTLDHFDVSIKL